MNLRNIQQWQSMFQEGRTNIRDNECKGRPSPKLDETVWCIHILLRQQLSYYYWQVIKDGRMLLTQNWQGNNSLCITTVWDEKSLYTMGSSTTLVRTLKKLHGSGTQLPYLVLGGWEWLTRANNYSPWKLDTFLQMEEIQWIWF